MTLSKIIISTIGIVLFSLSSLTAQNIINQVSIEAPTDGLFGLGTNELVKGDDGMYYMELYMGGDTGEILLINELEFMVDYDYFDSGSGGFTLLCQFDQDLQLKNYARFDGINSGRINFSQNGDKIFVVVEGRDFDNYTYLVNGSPFHYVDSIDLKSHVFVFDENLNLEQKLNLDGIDFTVIREVVGKDNIIYLAGSIYRRAGPIAFDGAHYVTLRDTTIYNYYEIVNAEGDSICCYNTPVIAKLDYVSDTLLDVWKFGSYGNDQIYDMQMDDADNIVISGDGRSDWYIFNNIDTLYTDFAIHYFVAKYDQDGNFLFANTGFDWNPNHRIIGIYPDGTDTYVTYGLKGDSIVIADQVHYSYNVDGLVSSESCFVVKYNNAGEIEWSYMLDKKVDWEHVYTLTFDSDHVFVPIRCTNFSATIQGHEYIDPDAGAYLLEIDKETGALVSHLVAIGDGQSSSYPIPYLIDKLDDNSLRMMAWVYNYHDFWGNPINPIGYFGFYFIDFDMGFLTSISEHLGSDTESILYPNPLNASQTLHLRSENQSLSKAWEIYATDGTLLRSRHLEHKEKEINIDITGIAAGTYVLAYYLDEILHHRIFVVSSL